MKVFAINIEKIDLNEREVKALHIILSPEGVIEELWDGFKKLKKGETQGIQLLISTDPEDMDLNV